MPPEAEATHALQYLPFAASLGVGGILALAMFFIHRKDSQEYATALGRCLETERLRGDRIEKLSEQMTQVVKENSEINGKLCEKLDRVIDERSGHDRRNK